MSVDFFREPIKRQEELCKVLALEKPDPLGMGETIFPNDENAMQTSIGTAITKTNVIHYPTSPYFIQPIMYGCVDYQFAPSPRHHQTPFIYRITQPNPATGHDIPIEVGKIISANKLSLERYYSGGLPAN